MQRERELSRLPAPEWASDGRSPSGVRAAASSKEVGSPHFPYQVVVHMPHRDEPQVDFERSARSTVSLLWAYLWRPIFGQHDHQLVAV